eukprot:CAMPEP_0183452220 /NCGR_PEP_ID=MMETSP0370-20130417/117259_1 /TAXON_ID=268820 /ORGANISM="Peridinium aciculiferum, Strain PAER-2" /LENGTH=129 /DNA_ID=CAMNT_0025643511 /DNA_START=397 /DNA_END=784 /DNA_ORIENTATION=+
MRKDSLSRSVAVDANAVHGVQGAVEDAEVVQRLGDGLLFRRQRLPAQAPAASAAIAGAPLLRGPRFHVLPLPHVGVGDVQEVRLLLQLDPVGNVVDRRHVPDEDGANRSSDEGPWPPSRSPGTASSAAI